MHLTLWLLFPLSVLAGPSRTNRLFTPVERAEALDAFKINLITYYGVTDTFAEQFKTNLGKAIDLELSRQAGGLIRRGRQDEDDDEDIEPSTSTTPGPSPFDIVNGIYGILTGVGTISPNKIFQSTVNFFPPSQKDTAQALIDSALGGKPKFPTPTTTIPTTSTPSTTTKDEYDEEDEDETTKAAVVAATPAPSIAAAVSVTSATVVQPAPAPAAASVATATATAAVSSQDDELELARKSALQSKL